MDIVYTKKATLRDIAKEVNISVSAVSMALEDHPQISDETKRRVKEITRKFGYKRPRERNIVPLSKINRGSITKIGFVLLGSRLHDEVHAINLHLLMSETSRRGIRLEVMAIEDMHNHKLVIDRILEFLNGIEGLLLSGYVDSELLRQIEITKTPYCIMGSKMAESASQTIQAGQFVMSDDIMIGKVATSRLISLGHQRTGFICETLVPGLYNHRLLSGYHLAHWDAGITISAEYVSIAGKNFAGGESAAEAMLLLKNPPSAYLIPDVRVAASFIDAMEKRGCQIEKNSIIITGHTEIAKVYRMEEYPMISPDQEKLVSAAISRLQQLTTESEPNIMTITIPFITYNF
jgi:DNA-binding LacI/PurR family transcriptional regulator